MSARGLAILAVLLLAIVAIVVFVDRPAPDEKKGDAPALLLSIPRADVRRVEIEHAGTATALERKGERGWIFAAPGGGEADPRRVEDLLKALEEARVGKVVAEKGADEGSYGLDRPDSVARVYSSSREVPVAVRVGRKSPVGSERYASIGDGRVVLVDASLATALERPPEELEERRLFPLEAEDVRRLRIARPEGVVALAREGNDWKVVEPFSDRADEGAADALVRALTSLSVSRREDGGTRIEAYAPIRLEIESAASVVARVTIEPGPPGGDSFARREDGSLQGPVSDAARKDLARDPADLRDRRVAVVPAQDVREIRIDSAGRLLRIRREKEEGPWTVIDPPGAAAVDGRKIDSFLDRIRWARVETFEPAEAGAPKADQVVTVKGKDGEEIVRLEIGPKATEGSRLAVRSTFRPGLRMTVSTESLSPVPASPVDFAPDPTPKETP